MPYWLRRYSWFFISLWWIACDKPNKPESDHTRKRTAYIRKIPGESKPIPLEVAQRGEVLIAYADCYTCHKEDKDSVGPAFKAIAERYPVQQAYIDLLAQKVISGGGGSWGRATMSAHPKGAMAEAKLMVSYILSLKKDAIQ